MEKSVLVRIQSRPPTSKEGFMDQGQDGFVNDICEYLEVPVCCHPDFNAGEVSEKYCMKCKRRAVPIKAKAIMLLRELYIHANEAGAHLCNLHGIIASSEIDELKPLLAKTLDEIEQFLKSINIKLPEEIKDNEYESKGNPG